MDSLRRKMHGWSWAMLCLPLLAGCQDGNPWPWGKPDGDDIVVTPANKLSVYQLATQLRMTVATTTSASAVLRNSSNTVVIFADPDGQATINGRVVGPKGGFVFTNGLLYVPQEVPAAIIPHLRASPPKPPTQTGTNTQGQSGSQTTVSGTVVLDAGHGGKDPGASSRAGGLEKDVNLAIARMTADALRRYGVNVIMTRNSDVFVELEDRPAVANRVKADAFVSIHADSLPKKPSLQGFTIYTLQAGPSRSLALAKAIEARLPAAGAEDKGIRQAEYRVLVKSSSPAVLVETGYLSNTAEAGRLTTPSYQNALANQIARGIVDFLLAD